jgi:hypothetical protein
MAEPTIALPMNTGKNQEGKDEKYKDIVPNDFVELSKKPFIASRLEYNPTISQISVKIIAKCGKNLAIIKMKTVNIKIIKISVNATSLPSKRSFYKIH